MLPIAVASTLVLAVMLGVVVDGGLIVQEQRHLQDVADAAARAGAAQIDESAWLASDGSAVSIDPPAARAAVNTFLDLAGFSDYTVTATSSIVTVQLRHQLPLVFGQLFGADHTSLSASSVARGRLSP